MTTADEMDKYIEEAWDSHELLDIPLVSVTRADDGNTKGVIDEKIIKKNDKEMVSLTLELKGYKESKNLSVKAKIAAMEEVRNTEDNLTGELKNKKIEIEKFNKS